MWERSAGEGSEGDKVTNGIKERKKWDEGTVVTKEREGREGRSMIGQKRKGMERHI
jgi:hypothetical protein